MSFSQFKIQQQVVKLLQRSLERERLAHAYLFTGSDTEELEAMARTLAQTLNCQKPPKRSAGGLPLDCCDTCLSCRKVIDGNHPDVHWVRPESKSRVITIDQIRELMEAVHLKPLQAGFKVGVIVCADRLNVQAANAFLKTLEEPPPGCVLILLSAQPERLLETIFSRCLRLHFTGDAGHGLSTEALEWFKKFCETATTGPKTLLSRYRVLGVLQSRLTQMKGAIEKALTDRSSLDKYPDADSALAEKWEQELAAAIEAEYRRQRSDLLVHLEGWLRDVWVQTLGMPRDQAVFPELTSFTQTVAGRLTPEAALDNLQVIENTQRLLETNVQEALALEVGLLKLQL